MGKESFKLRTDNDSAGKLIDNVNLMIKDTSCPEDIRRSIDVCIDEVCENIREYAYESGNGDYICQVSLGENELRMEFIDKGMAFNPLEENSDLGDDLQIGGLGIHLFTSIMDETAYSRDGDENHLVLVKRWDNQK